MREKFWQRRSLIFKVNSFTRSDAVGYILTPLRGSIRMRLWHVITRTGEKSGLVTAAESNVTEFFLRPEIQTD